MTKPGVRVLLWGGTAVAATVIASLAVAASVTAGGSVLTPEDIGNALTPTSASTRANPTATVGPPGTAAATSTEARSTATAAGGGAMLPLGPDQIGSGPYGSVTVRCVGDQAELRSWSPNPGYRADDPVRGPAAQVSVVFESDVADDVMVIGSCLGGQVAIVAQAEFDDQGGGRSGGGSGHG